MVNGPTSIINLLILPIPFNYSVGCLPRGGAKAIMMESAPRHMPLQSTIYKRKRGVPQPAHDSRKPLYQAVSTPLSIGIEQEPLICIVSKTVRT